MDPSTELRTGVITYQVIESRLSGIVQEMQDSIFRTGYSTIIRESQDASCMLMDAEGNVVGEHVILPLHVTCLPEVVSGLRARFGATIAPGDAFITNHPYLGGVPHSMDMAVVTPMFHAGQLVAFCGSIAHKSDLGGVVAGTANGNAREIFQEGIQYPPIRFMQGGAVVGDVEAILRANSRTPELVLGDIRGQVGVARLGERRLAEVIARYGLSDVLATFAERQRVTERRIRAEITGWPDGVREAESLIDQEDGVREAVRLHVRVEKQGDRLCFDFTGCDDQAQGPINIRPPLVRGCIAYALIGTIDPTLPNNGGIMRVAETKFRPGSVVDPYFPAPTNTYMPSAQAVTAACIDALAGFVGRRHARFGGYGATTIGGRRDDGTPFVQYELGGSAYGAHSGSDGVSGTAVLLSNSRCASIEVLESEFPTRVRRWELIRDSGGPGRFRGGLAAVRESEVLCASAQLSLRGHGHRWGAPGADGGSPGRAADCIVNAGTAHERRYPARFSGVVLEPGERVRVERGGGGGLGAPSERDFDAVAADVIDGYVSRAAAIADYGVDPARLDAAINTWQKELHPA